MQDRVIHQGHLHSALHKLFPHFKISVNSRKQATLRNPHSKLYCELDIWIPELHVCFEFQDSYHYITTWYSHSPIVAIQAVDHTKSELVRVRQDSLIVVPCWWDGEVTSLLASIGFHRPELLLLFEHDAPSDEHLPISLNPNISYFEVPQIPDVGELMLASYPSEHGRPLLLADSNSSSSSNHSWWIGEKYDGVRCCWHPQRRTLYSRSGLQLHVLPQFKQSFPPIFIDGELWFGRGQFAETQRIVTDSLIVDWQSLRVVAFDVPVLSRENENDRGSDHIGPQSLETRYCLLLINVLMCDSTFIITPPRLHYAKRDCMNMNINIDINHLTDEVMHYGGEGVILQCCNSTYKHGRSLSLFKLKASQEDQEGLVIYSSKSEGALLKLANGRVITVLPEKLQYHTTPKVGEIVTFSYNAQRKATPGNIQVQRVRQDITWREVVHSSSSSSSSIRLAMHPPPRLNDSSMVINRVPHQNNFLDPIWKDVVNRRVWFDKYAEKHAFDPLNPENWYSVTLAGDAKITQILRYYSGSLDEALVHLFPEIGFERHKFNKACFWYDTNNRVDFFKNFAKRHGFDPLLATNWYDVTKSHIVSQKGGSAVLNYYSGSPRRALLHLFPHIGLRLSLFVHVPKNHWDVPSNRRSFFESYAASRHFSPLVPSNWYRTAQRDILSMKGGSCILAYYKFSFKQALQQLFPEISFDPNRFLKLPRNYWSTLENRKAFFNHFATSSSPSNNKEQQAFETTTTTTTTATTPPTPTATPSPSPTPTITTTPPPPPPAVVRGWQHTITRSQILAVKGGNSVLKYYNGSHKRALQQLFPNVF